MAAIARVCENQSVTPTPVLELPDRQPRPGRDRRRAPRITRPFIARTAHDGPLLSGIDLSFGGLMCTCDEPIWPGNAIELELILPGDDAVVPVRGRVVELVSKDGEVAMRVRFDKLTAMARKRITAWMSR